MTIRRNLSRTRLDRPHSPDNGRTGLRPAPVSKDPLKDDKNAAERAYSHALSSGYEREAAIFKHAAEQIIEKENPHFFEAIGRMRRIPVPIDEFVDSKEFLAGVEYDIWPTLRADLRAMNPDVLIGQPKVDRVLLGGATGTGKSHLSTGTMAYQIYCLTCFEQPQRLFGLTPMTTIAFMMQSVTPTITKRVLYDPFRKMFTGMEYVKKWVEWNTRLESRLQLGDNIEVIPAQASLQAILGQAVCGAILDEVNFMQIIEESKQVAGPQGLGGRYDQAEVVWSNITRRRARSFTTLGPSFGCISAVSSTRYKDDFLDRKIDETEENAAEEEERNPKYQRSHLVFRHRQYAVNPKLIEAAKEYGYFRVLVGNEEYGTQVLRDTDRPGEHYPEDGLVIDIPATPEYRAAFKADPDAALRDIEGIATEAITPFFRRRRKITDALLRGKNRNLPCLTKTKSTGVHQDEFDLGHDGMPKWDLSKYPQSLRDKPHWAHIDLAKNKDKCGIGLCRLDGFVNVTGEDENGHADSVEVLPKLTIPAAVGLIPDAMNEVDIAAVRNFVLQLVKLGVNLRGITFDGFNSIESIQMVRKSGLHSEALTTMDRYEADYEAARDILYEDRLDIQPDCHGLALEMRTVEWYPERNSKRIDHPPRGTKDILDGVVGSISGALNDRTVRSTIEMVDQDNQRVRSGPDPRKKKIVRRKGPRRG